MQQDPNFYGQGGAPSGFAPSAVPPPNGQPADGAFSSPYGAVPPGAFAPQGAILVNFARFHGPNFMQAGS